MDIVAGAQVPDPSPITTFLFTDIEGSTRLWETQPEAMRAALARHDAIARTTVSANRGRVVKMTGDGIHAVFEDPLDAVRAAVGMQLALAGTEVASGIALRLRCGIHTGASERRDNDFFGSAVNRAARIMAAAHRGQILLSAAVVALAGDHPAGAGLRDLGRVRLRDLTNPERVYQVLHPQLRSDFPPLRSLEATPNNLPQQFTSFVGRETELGQACELLTRTRLLTLLGVGGLGKSRLALQIAAETLDRYADGVWLVELAVTADAGRVAESVASVLGVRNESGGDLDAALARHVADRELLIILDNCEHLIDACARLAKRLLQAGDRVRILATSREPLRINGETTLPMPALSLPDASTPMTPDALRRFDSVRLFVDRAEAADPAFRLDLQHAPAVAAICARLDGIPLALELAAARIRSLAPDAIAARLDDRFRLLVEGDRTALKRQQTLRALIDWSYDLLSPDEARLFRRLSVFAGGWTAGAAEAVAGGDGADPASVADLLAHLVDKSLAARDAGGTRYRYLETIREYADDRAERSGERASMRVRHVQHFLALAEAARPHLREADHEPWLERLDAERGNVLAAHRYCADTPGGVALDMRLAIAMRRYWFERGLLELGYRLTLDALSRPGTTGDLPLRAAALNDAGQIAAHMGRYGEARKHLVESLSIARSEGDRQRIGYLLQPLALACAGVGDLTAARGYLQEGLEVAREYGDPREVAAALNALAQIARMEGDLARAEPLYQQVLELARGARDIESLTMLNLAMVAIGRGSPPRARALLLEAAAICEEIDSRPTGQSLIEVSAALASSLGQPGRALRFYGAAERHAAVTGIHRDPADEGFLAPLIESARASLGSPASGDAESAGRALDYAGVMAEVRNWLAAETPPAQLL